MIVSGFNEELERGFFEEACFQLYQKQVKSGDVKPGEDGDGSREALFWRKPSGDYGVDMFNAAWFGWSQRAYLHVGPTTEVLGASEYCYYKTDKPNGDGL